MLLPSDQWLNIVLSSPVNSTIMVSLKFPVTSYLVILKFTYFPILIYTERWLQQTQYVGELERKIQRKFCIVLYIFQQIRHNFIYLLTSLPSCPGSPGDPLDPRLPCGKGNQTFWTILSLTIVSIQLNFANQKSLKVTFNKVNCHNSQSWRSSLQVFTSSFLQLSSYVLQ